MTDDELRALVRDAIARHAGRVGAVSASLPASMLPMAVVRQHASHALLSVSAGADEEGPCFIEPAVACNHCGYCQSYGH